MSELSDYIPFRNQQVPESVRAKLIAAMLLQKTAANSQTPIYSPLAGIAKLGAGAIGGAMEGYQINKEEQAQQASRDLLAKAFQQRLASGGNPMGSPAAQAPASASSPAPAAAAGVSVSPESSNSAPASGAAAHIQQKAAELGIDPNIALTVARHEGLNATQPGDHGSSFSPFQLHYGGIALGGNAVAGLGDDFTKQTGLDARDPANTNAAIDFALEHAAKNGWGAFHGAAAAKIGNWDGIGGKSAATPTAAAPLRGSQGDDTLAPSPLGAPGNMAPNADPSLRDQITAAMLGQDPAMGPVPTAAPTSSGLTGGIMQPAQMNTTAPGPDAGGLGAAPAVGTLPGPDAPLPGDIPTAPNMVPPNAIPNAPPDADPEMLPTTDVQALPQTGPMPPPGGQTQALLQALQARQAQQAPAIPPDASSLASVPPTMAANPAQQAISAQMGGAQALPEIARNPFQQPGSLATPHGNSPADDPSSAQNFAQGGMGGGLAQLLAARSGAAASAGPAPGGPAQAPGPSPLASMLAQQQASPSGAQPAPAGQPQDTRALLAQALADPRISDQMKQMLFAPPPGIAVKASESVYNPLTGNFAQAPAGPITAAPNDTILRPGMPPMQAPSGPIVTSPGQQVTNPNQPGAAPISFNPPTPDFAPVPGTGRALNKTNGQTTPIEGGVNTPATTGLPGGVSLPTTVKTNPDGSTSATLNAPGGSLAAAAPLVKQAQDMQAQGAASEQNAKDVAGSVQKAADQGQEARARMGELTNLQALSKTAGAGAPAMVRQYLAEKGISISPQADDTQAYNGLRDYLSTQLRQAGSGALRNSEMDKLAGNLGSLSMSPDARQASIQRMVDTYGRVATLGDVAANPDLSPAERQSRMHDIAGTWSNAEAAIAAHPDKRALILQKMQAAGIPAVGF